MCMYAAQRTVSYKTIKPVLFLAHPIFSWQEPGPELIEIVLSFFDQGIMTHENIDDFPSAFL